MSAKNLDSKGRLRNKIVSFRMSPQEAKLLDDYVFVLGFFLFVFFFGWFLCFVITVNPGPRVYKGLRDKLNNVYSELCRIEKGSEISEETLCLICYMSAILREMGG